MKAKMYYKMALVAVFLVTSCFLLASSLLAYTGTITDNFNDNTLNTGLWKTFSSGAGFSVNEINQRLEISLPGTASGTANVASKLALSGDFDMQVDFALPTWPNANGAEVALVFNNNYSNVFAGVALFGAHDGYNQVYYGETSAGFGSTSETNIAQGGSGSLRITRTVNTIDCYFMGPTDWVNVAHVTDPSLAIDGTVLLSCGLSQETTPGGAPIKVAFDNFWVQYTKVIWHKPLPSLPLLLLE